MATGRAIKATENEGCEIQSQARATPTTTSAIAEDHPVANSDRESEGPGFLGRAKLLLGPYLRLPLPGAREHLKSPVAFADVRGVCFHANWTYFGLRPPSPVSLTYLAIALSVMSGLGWHLPRALAGTIRRDSIPPSRRSQLDFMVGTQFYQRLDGLR